MNTDSHRISAEEAAAAWDARLRNSACSAAERQAFEDWLAASPEHRMAYERLQAMLSVLRANAAHPRLRALRDMGRVKSRQPAWRRPVLAAGLAAALLVTGGGAWGLLRTDAGEIRLAEAGALLGGADIHRTALAERSLVRLEDGSEVLLDSETQMVVRLTGGRRDVRLLSGRATFAVAKDTERPFVVTAGDRTITALGTAFEVSLIDGSASVTLMEGRVSVTGERARPVVLAPSEQLASNADAQPKLVDVGRILSWTEGRLYFDDEPLGSAVAAMNRYSETKIVLGDPRLAGLRVNGMFRTGNQTGFVGALQVTFPVEVRRDDRDRLVVSPARAAEMHRSR